MEGRWTPTRTKAQDTRASLNSLETHLVRKWGWAPTGAEPLEQWMDGWILSRCLVKNF